MDNEKLPLVFANRLIRRLVNNVCGSDLILTPGDYTVLRVVFRRCRGSWEAVVRGDVVHTRLLTNIVTSWGGMPGRQRRTDFG